MRVSPVRRQHLDHEAMLAPYGPADAEGRQPELVETFGPLELEYAAIRKSAAILDRPDRGTVIVTGAERIAFLNNMLTQELRPSGTDIEPFTLTHSFWLNRKGRVDADLRVVQLGDRTIFELDVHNAADTVETLSGFIFAEDAELRDHSEQTHRLDLFGPGAFELLQGLAKHTAGPPLGELDDRKACIIELAGASVVVARDESTGGVGLLLFVPADATEAVYNALIEAGAPEDPEAPPNTDTGRVRLRRIGWHAYNIARLEAGTPLFNLDFGPANLPAETGVLEDRVSFTKGCYLGQEVVARMHSLGKPKQSLVALMPDAAAGRQPVGGAGVYDSQDADSPIGAVTSSTISPLSGSAPVCFAMLKTKHAAPGTELWLDAEGQRIGATVRDRLRFVEA